MAAPRTAACPMPAIAATERWTTMWTRGLARWRFELARTATRNLFIAEERRCSFSAEEARGGRSSGLRGGGGREDCGGGGLRGGGGRRRGRRQPGAVV